SLGKCAIVVTPDDDGYEGDRVLLRARRDGEWRHHEQSQPDQKGPPGEFARDTQDGVIVKMRGPHPVNSRMSQQYAAERAALG
ncbi:MAG TPA: hypothetical protein VGQ90_15585, partial [Stellaceae bacterium]|nr:hypothetical protein [Stellaceae bacterium]